MGLYVGSIVVNTVDMERGIAFWTEALGYVVQDADATFAVLTDPERRWSNLSLQHSDQPKEGRNRIHLDLYTRDRDCEVARLEGAGATRLPWKYAPEPDFVVMADPDGNEFCVVQSSLTQQ